MFRSGWPRDIHGDPSFGGLGLVVGNSVVHHVCTCASSSRCLQSSASQPASPAPRAPPAVTAPGPGWRLSAGSKIKFSRTTNDACTASPQLFTGSLTFRNNSPSLVVLSCSPSLAILMSVLEVVADIRQSAGKAACRKGLARTALLDHEDHYCPGSTHDPDHH